MLSQRNALRWERVDPPWELPDYVGDLAQALQVMGAWIASGGAVEQEVGRASSDSPSTLGSQRWRIRGRGLRQLNSLSSADRP